MFYRCQWSLLWNRFQGDYTWKPTDSKGARRERWRPTNTSHLKCQIQGLKTPLPPSSYTSHWHVAQLLGCRYGTVHCRVLPKEWGEAWESSSHVIYGCSLSTSDSNTWHITGAINTSWRAEHTRQCECSAHVNGCRVSAGHRSWHYSGSGP